MTTADRFTLEEQILSRLQPAERKWYNARSDTVKRSLALAAGFMDVEVIIKVIREIQTAPRP